MIHHWKGISPLFLKPLKLKSIAAAAERNSQEIISVEKIEFIVF